MTKTPEAIQGIPWRELTLVFPQIEHLAAGRSVFWNNTRTLPAGSAIASSGYTAQDVEDAALRMRRFAPFLAKVFPETAGQNGIVESPLRDAGAFARALAEGFSLPAAPRLLFKLDSELNIGASMNARGGIYETLKLAEDLAIAAGLLKWSDNYEKLADESLRGFFGQFTLGVASEGNLSLAVARMGNALGFKVVAHAPARSTRWKKDLLLAYGASLVEHDANHGECVALAREKSAADGSCFFVDEEHSRTLFLGYATAGLYLKTQLERRGMEVGDDHPLYVYLPCGMGEGPSAVCFGLKLAYRDAVRVYIAESAAAPGMLLGLGTKLHDKICAQDIGLDGRSVADELQVSRPSGHSCLVMQELLDGCVTVRDSLFLQLLALAYDTERVKLEPSALAGAAAFISAMQAPGSDKRSAGTHIIWATGGGMLPHAEWRAHYENGKNKDV